MDSLIQVGRRHNNAQPLGPHPFNVPEDNELRTLVSNQISRIHTSFLGLDTIKPPLIKCARKRVPKQIKRSWENVNEPVLLIAALFKMFIVKANIPRSWKEAKITPTPQKGPVIQLGNDRMIAISGTS